MKLGLLGGTFDPIHVGHLVIAKEVRLRLALSEILFIPAGNPWLKSERTITPGEHRLEMVRLAISSHPHFTVSDIELKRPGPSYSVDTVSALREELGRDVGLYLIIGYDELSELSLWKEPVRLAEMCHIVGVKRPGYAKLNWHSLEQAVGGISSRVIVLDVPQLDVSSTQIRQRIATGLSIRYLVPEAVERYILEHGLYR
jgi:nicotinate-nucleotide adenylyltransferase